MHDAVVSRAEKVTKLESDGSDEFFMCAALMPQVRAVYRYGHLKDCTPKWDDFKYCMSLKSEDEEERRKMWIKRRAEWWAGRRVGPSSEDVWEVRE